MLLRSLLFVSALASLAGCDIFLVDNPNNCEKAPGICGSAQRCNHVLKTCVAGPATPLNRPSRASSIALSNDGSLVAMTNPEDGTLSVFRTMDNSLLSRVPTGPEPQSVVLHPDGKTAFVANRGDATVVKLTGVNSGQPKIAGTVKLGAEPTGLALTPNGDRLFVAEFSEGRVTAIDAFTMTVLKSASDVRNPRTLAVTNNGDSNDDDELVVVPEFFGEPQAGREGQNDGRVGHVHLYRSDNLMPVADVALQPLSSSDTGGAEGAAPNQLGSVAINGTRAYITAIAAAPQPPLGPDQMVREVLYVVDLSARAQARDATGTVDLTRKLIEAQGDPAAKLFLADLVDVDFVPGKGVAYGVSRGADVVQRVVFDAVGNQVTVGSSMNLQIDVSAGQTLESLSGCAAPSGIAVASSQRAYVNCWLSRRLGVLDLGMQTLLTAVPAADLPTKTADQRMQRGKRFFHSARDRWGLQGWVSCATCHPDGLTDGVTWIFPDGPRQTPAVAASFSHGASAQKQRVLGWTGTADEVHDFERIVRMVAGGLGALTKGKNGMADCGTLATEVPLTQAQDLLGSPTSRELMQMGCNDDWDQVQEYLASMRPPHGRRTLDAASVQRGAMVFMQGNCHECHGGGGFTVSNRFYTPSTALVTSLATTVRFTAPTQWAHLTFQDSFQIAPQPKAAEGGGMDLGPLQVACAVRNLGTFGADSLEKKSDGTRAQGKGGYNVPSLYGLSVSAPYLHAGQVTTLDQLFSDSHFATHYQAGNANFLADQNADQDRQDLINYLLSIDANTAEFAVPAGFDAGCATSN